MKTLFFIGIVMALALAGCASSGDDSQYDPATKPPTTTQTINKDKNPDAE